MSVNGRVKDFKDLEAWKQARELRKLAYGLAKRFPAEERYALGSQLRRASLSVTANIAEGFGRFSYRENIQYCRQARASAFELRDHLTTAYDAGYLSKKEGLAADALAQRVIQILNGYIRATRRRESAAG